MISRKCTERFSFSERGQMLRTILSALAWSAPCWSVRNDGRPTGMPTSFFSLIQQPIKAAARCTETIAEHPAEQLWSNHWSTIRVLTPFSSRFLRPSPTGGKLCKTNVYTPVHSGLSEVTGAEWENHTAIPPSWVYLRLQCM